MASKELRVLWHLSEVIAFRGLPSEEVFRRFLADRDDQAFQELLRRHGKAVYLQCKKVLRSEDLVHEAFQTTFVNLVLKGHTIKHQGNVGGWLVRTARNGALNIQRGLATRQKIEQSLGAELANNLPESKVKDLNRQAEVFALLSQLPENYRAVLTLCVIHGATHAEAASKLRWPVGTVATRVSKGLEMLKRMLERKGWGAAGATLPVILASKVEAVPPDVSSAAIKTAMTAMSMHTGWKVLVAGLWGAFLGYWTWLVAGVILFGLGLGTIVFANRPTADVAAVENIPFNNIKLIRQQIHQKNVQLFRSEVVPKVVAAMQKLKFWNEPVKVIDVTTNDFLMICQLEQNAKFGKSSTPWLTTRTAWHYNVLNGSVFVTFDLKGDNQWKELSLDGPISIENPWTKASTKISLTALTEARQAFKMLAVENMETDLKLVESDPKLRTLRSYLGKWHIEGDKNRQCHVLITDEKIPLYVDFDGRISVLHLLPDQKQWVWEGWGLLQLEKEGNCMNTGSGRWWMR